MLIVSFLNSGIKGLELHLKLLFKESLVYFEGYLASMLDD